MYDVEIMKTADTNGNDILITIERNNKILLYKWKNIKWRAFIIYRWILTKFSRQRWYDTSSLNRIPFLTKFYGTEYSKSKTEYLANLKMLANLGQIFSIVSSSFSHSNDGYFFMYSHIFTRNDVQNELWLM